MQTEAILESLNEIGIDWAQGYHVGEPMRLKEIFGEGTITDMADLVDINSNICTDLETVS